MVMEFKKYKNGILLSRLKYFIVFVLILKIEFLIQKYTKNLK